MATEGPFENSVYPQKGATFLQQLRESPALSGVLSGIAVAVVLTAGYLVYMPGLSGSFLFDDFPNIVNNDRLKMAALTLDQLLSAAFSSHAGPLYRPIAMVSFALNRYFAGLDPYWFKFTNVMIHLACGVLVIALSRLLLASYREQRALWLSEERVRWVALLLGAAWIVNPLNLTAVLYVVQRMVSLASFFMLASTCFYVVGRRRQLAGRSGWAFIWIGAPLMALLGLFSKEIAALMPLYLVVIEAVIFRFRGGRVRFDKPIIVFYTLGLVLPFLCGLGWLLIHLHGFLGGYHGRPFTIVERLLTETRILMLDIKWTLIPNVADLSLYHDDIALSTGLLAPVTTLLSILGIVALLIVVWLTRRRAPLVALGILWFFAGHALESTILPLEIVHEHRNYLPDYGLLLAVISLLLIPRAPTRKFLRAGTAVGLVFAALLANVTWARSSEWSSKLTQAYYEAQHHPSSPRATYSYAALEADLAMHGRLKNPAAAFRDLEASLQTNKSAMPNVALVMLASSLKQPIKPVWLAGMQRKLHTRLINSEDVDSLNKLVQCVTKTCKLNRRQMEAIFRAAFTNPRLSHHSYNYANTLTIYINYLTQQHAPLDKLIHLMYTVVAAQPQISQYRVNLANALLAAGEVERAQVQVATLRKMNTIGQLDETIQNLEELAKKKSASERHSRTGKNPVESERS
ncbi:MAG TPA: hypothetical protein VFK24_06595 [Gammaproteobacteria bacterium]|nr:hypothetical protein [Gammaproteobacteria bacterium]